MTESTSFILIELGSTSYGIAAIEIRELTELGEVSPLPDSQGFLLGITQRRGVPTPVLDLGALLGHGPTPDSPLDRLVFLDVLEQPVAYRVSHARSFVEIPKEELKPAPSGRKSLEFVSHIAQSRGKLVLILDNKLMLEHTLGVVKI